MLKDTEDSASFFVMRRAACATVVPEDKIVPLNPKIGDIIVLLYSFHHQVLTNEACSMERKTILRGLYGGTKCQEILSFSEIKG